MIWQQLVSLAQKTLDIADCSCLLFVDCLLEQKSFMRNSWLSDWRIAVVFHCQLLILDGCYKTVSLPLAPAMNVNVQWVDLLLADRSVVCLWISVSPDGQSRLHPHTVGEQPRHSHVLLLPQGAGRLGAGGRTTVRPLSYWAVTVTALSLNSAFLFISNCWAFAASDLKDVI